MKQRILIMSFGILLISGILLAASDGTLFPWPNILGVLLTASAALMVPGLNRGDEAAHRTQPAPHLRMVSSNALCSLNFQKGEKGPDKTVLSGLSKETAADSVCSAAKRAV